MNIDGEDITIGEFLAETVDGLRYMRAIGRETKKLAGQPGTVREELVGHLAGWITSAVQQHTGGTTDLSGARTWGDITQRLCVAASLLADHPADQVGQCLDAAHEKAGNGLPGVPHRTCAWVLIWVRDAEAAFKTAPSTPPNAADTPAAGRA